MYDFSKLWRFPGGLRLAAHKQLSTQLPVLKSTLPRQLSLALRQYDKTDAKPIVNVGDTVFKGQAVAVDNADNAVVHASSSGRVIALERRLIAQPDYPTGICIVIETDGREQWSNELSALADFRNAEPVQLLERIGNAGIVGLGGAAFPSAAKLAAKTIDLVIVNGAECEPYISCDDMLMRERAIEVLSGLSIIRYILQAKQAVIAIEDNKPEAYQALVSNRYDDVELRQIPTLYPSGGERQLIRILTGKEVPSGAHPSDIGIVCINVATAAAVHDAVVLGRPLISRYVTVSGAGVQQPRVLEALIGTPFRDLIEQCGGYAVNTPGLSSGGSMMGFAVADDAVALMKNNNCLLVRQTQLSPIEMPCIRCGACIEVCPMRLLPQQLYWHTKAKQFEQSQEQHLFDCIECACCEVVCPSQIPLVDYYRRAKAEIRTQQDNRENAEHARQRFEARQQRLAREETERELRLQQKKATESNKKAAIQAALARANAKRKVRPDNLSTSN